jgi:adenylylsulfate reductase subunit B
MPPVVNEEKCIGCGRCVIICPEDVFYGTPGGGEQKGIKASVSHPDLCWHCNWCVTECPVEGAIEISIPLRMRVPFLEET